MMWVLPAKELTTYDQEWRVVGTNSSPYLSPLTTHSPYFLLEG